VPLNVCSTPKSGKKRTSREVREGPIVLQNSSLHRERAIIESD
jgi:hypothetical protein